MGITVADLVLAALLILAILYGWRWGTINVVAKVGSLVLAYYAARAFSALIATSLVDALPPFGGTAEAGEAASGGDQLLSFLSLFIDTSSAANWLLEIVVFIIIFIVVNWAVRKIAYAVTSIFGRGLLGKLNSALGAFIALVLMIALIIIVTDIFLPACIDMGFGESVANFLATSTVLLPFMEYLAALL